MYSEVLYGYGRLQALGLNNSEPYIKALEANSRRAYATILNDTDASIYIALGTYEDKTTWEFRALPGTYFLIPYEYKGEVSISTASPQTVEITVIEFTQ